MKTEDEITAEFMKLLCQLSNKQFWEYIADWYDESLIFDTMNDWDIDTKKEAIKELKKVLKK